ncbi:MAG TPA: twin-arginine translocase TatA/TatE family subunit [Bacteroidales bacterium]|jgi:sec-independent protein translocase protein TatA|nr:twin-arginine translocase TatA/TatE family subunit [Bacteroidales bacterium]HNQ83190.1 twin-arginine translocase TatA/TatE family subunit [Bacteroidales bacterium]HOX79349.1 twin-arginine translocase TatA/TatE family subunit [Bacteroidales bacterium]HPI86781.1 twin-arginine translocase TatA/TatE family subunit [Bacteroidales bacterium]HPM92880.1 twin-arginine translocase TatA/TatE family subunit [Bacteroidales bacterium]
MNTFLPLLSMPSGTEWLLILAVVLLIFGGRKIPELMKGIGKGAREFKKGMSGDYDEEPKKDVPAKKE